MSFIFMFLLYANSKSLEVRFTEIAPVIDGYIEEIWLNADSAYDYTHTELLREVPFLE